MNMQEIFHRRGASFQQHQVDKENFSGILGLEFN